LSERKVKSLPIATLVPAALVVAASLSAPAARLASFLRVELMRGALLMSSLAALGSYFALLCLIHTRETSSTAILIVVVSHCS
jgi:hypothetical protein